MNIPEQEIEDALRRVPQPRPPAGLKQELLQQVKLPARPDPTRATQAPVSSSWLQRWWPALAPAAASVACAVVISVQQGEINDLKQSIQTLTEAIATVPDPVPVQTQGSAGAAGNATSYQEEIARLKQRATQLAAEVAQLEKLGAENGSLRTQLVAAAATVRRPPVLQDPDADALAKLRERDERIQCVYNLKQLGLAVRIWAQDNGDIFPPNILSMTNEMATTKILICPSDTVHQPAANWASFTSANCSYEFLAPSGSETEPTRVLFRCPLHGNICLSDWSVQQVGNDHPDWFKERDGKLYLESPTSIIMGLPRLSASSGMPMVPTLDQIQAALDGCINNLRMIDGAKEQWALENKKSMSAIVTVQDLEPYFKGGALPGCPAGGNYTLNSIGASPTCSIPGHDLP